MNSSEVDVQLIWVALELPALNLPQSWFLLLRFVQKQLLLCCGDKVLQQCQPQHMFYPKIASLALLPSAPPPRVFSISRLDMCRISCAAAAANALFTHNSESAAGPVSAYVSS